MRRACVGAWGWACIALAWLTCATLSFNVAAVENAVAGSSRDSDLLGKDENGDGVRDDLALYVRSISEDHYIERDLLYLAQARTQAMMSDPQDRESVRAAFDRVFVAKACLTRDIDEFHYQLTLMSRIESALLNTGMRMNAMRRVMEADSGNTRNLPDDREGRYACPLPQNPEDVADHMAKFLGVSADGQPVNYIVRYAKPSKVWPSEDDTELKGADADGNGVRDDLQVYLRSLSQEPLVIRALLFKAKADTAMLLAGPDDVIALQMAMRDQTEAWACLNRDIRHRKLRNKFSRRLGLHLLNTEQRAIAMRKASLAAATISQDANATSRVKCLLPEVILR